MAERCPEPPSELPEPRSDELFVLRSRVLRVFFRDGPYPTDWMEFRTAGPLPTGRFDHHVVRRNRSGSPPGVMYATRRGDPPAPLDALSCALAETFQATRVIDTSSRDPWVVWWTPARPVHLLDLGSTWLARAGGNQALCSGERSISRSWARSIHAASSWPAPVDGLTWPSSVLGPGRNVVLFESAADAVPYRPDVLRMLADPGLGPAIERVARSIGYLVA